MNSKHTTKTAAILALAGILNASHAKADGHTFTPLERLAPEIRKNIMDQINQVDGSSEIDWDQIVLGLDEDEKLVFMEKTGSGIKPIASPSTYSSIGNLK